MRKNKYIVFLLIVMLSAFVHSVSAAPAQAPFADQVVFNSEFILYEDEVFFGNIISFNGSILIEEGATLHGDLILFGGDVTVYGDVFGNVISFGTDNSLDTEYGYINGEVIAFGGESEGMEDLYLDQPTAMLVKPSFVSRMLNNLWFGVGEIMGIVLASLAFSTIAILLHIIVKDRIEVTLTTLRTEPVVSFFIGLILFIVVPILSVIMTITILLIPLTLVLLLFFVLMLFVSIAVMGELIGKFLMNLFKTNWTEIIQIGVGTFVFVMSLIFLMKLPCIGWSLTMLILSFGMGSFLMSSFGSRVFSRES